MGKKTLVSIIILLLPFLLMPSLLSSQTQEYKEYTVKKGDTLWDITRNELNDSFLWPKVWKENPEIINPDRIYPNQKIKIPLYLIQKEIPAAEIPEVKKEIKKEPKKEVVRKIEPIRKGYLVDRGLLLASGYITDAVHSLGKITGSPSERKYLGKDDYAYITTEIPTKKGEKFYVFQVVQKVTHPTTGLMMGYLIEILGIAEVIEQEDGVTKAKILASYSDIPGGALLEPYYEIEPPFAIDKPRKPDIDGWIVATRQLHTITGQFDIVYIDRGRNRGLEIGDILATATSTQPRRQIGLIQIINVKETTATAIVRKSSEAISKGDGITATK